MHSTPLIGQRGDVLGAISIHIDRPPRDTTERECTLADICEGARPRSSSSARAQAAFEESQGRFQAVLDASAVPFVVLAPVREASSGQIVDFEWNYVNEAAAKALRHPAGAFEGKRVQDVLPRRWATSASFLQYVAVADNLETREFETHVRYDGTDTWFHCVASPMRGDVALWFSDVTQRKRDEQSLQEADRRKDEFLATLAHELRNPLAPIRQATAISRMPTSTDAQKRWSHDVIERQVRHMALLLDDLLDVSRITRGVLSLRRGPNELGEMLDAAVETARPLVDGRQHELEVVAPQAAIVMQADPLRVSQIIANLLTNAAKYTEPHGHIRLAAALDDDDVVIEVSDNGIGIAPESLPAVFDMFTQLRGTDDRAGGGLGIGLALTKGLVELHGGSIVVRSDGVGCGSVFTVRLPRGEAAQPPPSAPRPDAPPRAASARRILVADDNRDAAESLAALLELEGHQVTLAFDGADALSAYERVRPDICLLDIGMPHHSGNEVAIRIRAGAQGSAHDAHSDHRLGPGRRPPDGARRGLRPPPDEAGRPAAPAAPDRRDAGERTRVGCGLISARARKHVGPDTNRPNARQAVIFQCVRADRLPARLTKDIHGRSRQGPRPRPRHARTAPRPARWRRPGRGHLAHRVGLRRRKRCGIDLHRQHGHGYRYQHRNRNWHERQLCGGRRGDRGPVPADGSAIGNEAVNALAATGIVRSDIRSSFGT